MVGTEPALSRCVFGSNYGIVTLYEFDAHAVFGRRFVINLVHTPLCGDDDHTVWVRLPKYEELYRHDEEG